MESPKRSLQVNVRLAPDDLKLMRQAAQRLWPGLAISNSTLLLTLARLHAEATMGKKK